MPDELGVPSGFVAEGVRRPSPDLLALDAIHPIANLPVFFKLGGPSVVLAGESEAAVWKAEIFAASCAAWAGAAKEWRPQFSELGTGFRHRRNFWERFATLALASGGREPDSADLSELMTISAANKSAGTKGQVVLVGGGPGDAE